MKLSDDTSETDHDDNLVHLACLLFFSVYFCCLLMVVVVVVVVVVVTVPLKTIDQLPQDVLD